MTLQAITYFSSSSGTLTPFRFQLFEIESKNKAHLYCLAICLALSLSSKGIFKSACIQLNYEKTIHLSKLFVIIEAKMTLKIKSPTIKNLEHLLEINDFKGFCDEYENNEKYLQNNDISYAVSNIETPTIALPYVKFLLDKQIQSYSVVLLEYLVKHNFTKEFIDFLESIKDITLYAYDNKSVNIIKSICKNKNMKCLDRKSVV